jgi:hypothetical protein
MYQVERQGKGNASRFQSTRGALTVLAAASLLLSSQSRLRAQSRTDTLPDAPSALLSSAGALPVEGQNASQSAAQNAPQDPSQNAQPLPPAAAAPATQAAPAIQTAPVKPLVIDQPGQALSDQAASASLPPCPKREHTEHLPIVFVPPSTRPACQQQDQLQLIVDTGHITPLRSSQKGVLAIRAVTDPFNLLTILTFSGVSVAADSHSVYGPGFAGWGRLSGYSLAEDIQGEFTGTYLIPSLVHEDPRYHRMPGAPMSRRIKHALIHTFVTQHDNGSLMPNYASLINYPLSAEISNLYVPGLATNGASTAKRVFIGYATDPIGPVVAEFLPDFAKRVHIHIVFAQQILNHLALGSGAQPSSF